MSTSSHFLGSACLLQDVAATFSSFLRIGRPKLGAKLGHFLLLWPNFVHKTHSVAQTVKVQRMGCDVSDLFVLPGFAPWELVPIMTAQGSRLSLKLTKQEIPSSNRSTSYSSYRAMVDFHH